MARHIMAVCVVCLLCADHLPCKQHDEEVSRISPPATGGGVHTTLYRRELTYRRLESPRVGHGTAERKHRMKRHTHDGGHHHGHSHDGHGHDHEADDEEHNTCLERSALVKDKLNPFVTKIFAEFGDTNSMTMDVAGFESMMKRLNLYRLVTEEEPAGTVRHSFDLPGQDEAKCIGSVDFVKALATQGASVEDYLAEHTTSSPQSSTVDIGSNKTSLNQSNAASFASTSKAKSPLERLKATLRINQDDLLNICPILLAQLTSKTSLEQSGCLEPSLVPNLGSLLLDVEGSQNVSIHHTHQSIGDIPFSVWLYSSLTILGVSLCGLLGVAVIPCMDKHFYQHALQVLVALAVGTLCGDALLHLLPHAMLQTTMANHHDEMMYKGLAAVGGIVFFYFMERFLTVAGEWYKKGEKKDKPSARVRVMREEAAGSLRTMSSGEKLCKHKYSSYPYCYDEIAMETKDDHHEHNNVSTTASKQQQQQHNHNHNNAQAKCIHHGDEADHAHEHNNSIKDDQQQQQLPDNNTVSTNLDDASIESEQANARAKLRPENYTIILREHETMHHGHSHTHGHVFSPPGSLSAVAWMVIMGDGLHNFTDGMTIGAAFANNIAGGFSTAIAVFCHELPHELGDFAVLLKAGMSPREAVYYNLLSSILSFIGVPIGIIVGHQPAASAWVFAVAAGLFIYIALVDMIPELTSAHGSGGRCKTSEFLLQFFGMSAGFGIMLVIAMYEHDLKQMFVN